LPFDVEPLLVVAHAETPRFCLPPSLPLPPPRIHFPAVAGIMAGAWPLQVSAVEIPFDAEKVEL